jgi:hypothetical protein
MPKNIKFLKDVLPKSCYGDHFELGKNARSLSIENHSALVNNGHSKIKNT